VVVVGVHVWSQGKAMEEARGFARKHGLSYAILVDTKDTLIVPYGVQGVPTNVVIGKNGKVYYAQPDYDGVAVRQAIEAALKD
jgi:peroxiredoxin